MPELTQEQLDQIVKRAVDEATSGLQERLTKVEKNRDAILTEKRALEGRKERSLDEAVKRVTNYSNPTSNFQTADQPVVFKRGGTPQEYQAAKALAAERGVNLVFEDDSDTNGYGMQERQSSPVKFLETDREFFVNKNYIEKVGVVRARAMAEERGKPMVAFRDPQQLPPEAATKHQQVLDARDSDTLLVDGGE